MKQGKGKVTARNKRQATWAKAKNTSSPRAKSRGRKGKDKDKAKERASGGSNKRLGGYSDDMEEKARAKAKAKSKDTARARENARKAGRAKAKAKARKVDRRKLQMEHEREGKLGLRHERLSERRINWRQMIRQQMSARRQRSGALRQFWYLTRGFAAADWMMMHQFIALRQNIYFYNHTKHACIICDKNIQWLIFWTVARYHQKHIPQQRQTKYKHVNESQ